MCLFSMHSWRALARALALLLAMTEAVTGGTQSTPAGGKTPVLPGIDEYYTTNVSQFRTLSGAGFAAGCTFHLTGVVTLVDTNRDLVVLQDETGAVALHFKTMDQKLQFGRRVTLDGTLACLYFAGFPDFPFFPSGRDICSSFETPTNWGEYNLTRMRGCLHPEITGDYQFWIASDDSSELWLSTDSNPANVRKIASVPFYMWTNPRQWSKYPSQRSELIPLKAGETYYIEALQEQSLAEENLSVGWHVPTQEAPKISVITGAFLTPWPESGRSGSGETHGILREYWTNYFAGNVDGLAGARPYESALTVKEAKVTDHGAGQLPKPDTVVWNQPLTGKNNYRWVRKKGLVKFKSFDGGTGVLEIFDGRAIVPVQILHCTQEKFASFTTLTSVVAQVEGVCEGIKYQQENMVPGFIWVQASDKLTFAKAGSINEFTTAEREPPLGTAGYFLTRGVVTFNDQAFDKNYTFIQDDGPPSQLSVERGALRTKLHPGEYIDVAGLFQRGKYIQVIMPNRVTLLGPHPMPLAITPSTDLLNQSGQEGRWCQFEGVVHSLNANGTLMLKDNHRSAYLWLGKTPSNELAPLVDAKLKARGVLMLHLMDAPVLLVPGRNFVDVEESPPENPFNRPQSWIASLPLENADVRGLHRRRVIGEVTYCDEQSFIIQDESGSIRVQSRDNNAAQVGDWVEVVAFPAADASRRLLDNPLVRLTNSAAPVSVKKLDLNSALSSKQIGALVQAGATLMGQRTNGIFRILELEDQQHIFTATLRINQGEWPDLAPGSRLQVTGVVADGITTPAINEQTAGQQFSTPLNILLRRPRDVVLISGPPWWTWKKTAGLVGVLLTTLAVAFLWVYFLRRRLKRQQAAQLVFSQHVLGKLEEERHRIAVNLHDSLGHSLLVIKNHALLATQSPQGFETQSRMSQISTITTQAIEEVRRIAQGLRPSQLDRLGLAEAIRASVNRASGDSPISFATRIENIDGLLDKDAEIHVFRIVQEAVTNVVKHSSATEAAVVVKKMENTISLSVRDNGCGFDPAQPATPPQNLGYGLAGLAQRVKILKGSLNLESQMNAGTRLTVEIPFKV